MKIRTIGVICTLISEEHERKRSAYEKAKKAAEDAKERGEETATNLRDLEIEAIKELGDFENCVRDFLSFEVR